MPHYILYIKHISGFVLHFKAGKKPLMCPDLLLEWSVLGRLESCSPF